MQSFLEKTVIHLSNKYGHEISDLCIVLPNRRAGLFLKTHFANQLKKTFWSPEIFAIEDFISVLSENEIIDSSTLLFELYETVKSISHKETESFDDFCKWGQILLNDFNEIDRYLVDASQLFGNLKDIKELESWSLNAAETTDFQKQYLLFWQSLKEYYFNFQKRLQAKNQVYQGLANKIVADTIEEKIKKHDWEKIVFAGFNALNKAEEIIIEKLISVDKAEIIWDTDAYYFNNPNQEAGKFLQRYNTSGKFNRTKNRNLIIQENSLSDSEKGITIIGAAKNIAQAKVAGNIISTLKKEDDDLQNTALVLADENLLFPVLNSLPENLTDINITMGYPLKNTPIAGFMDLIFNLHEHGLKLNKDKLNYSFYHSDLIKLLSHLYFSLLIAGKENKYSVKKVIDVIQNRNIVFASLTLLENIFTEMNCEKEFEIAKPIFIHWKGFSEAFICINYVIDLLKNSIIQQEEKQKEQKANLEIEYLLAFKKITNRVNDLITEYPETITNIKTLRSIISQLIRITTLPFYGEPLKGLQIMGMLETRTLDFENIVLLSCNEDILPSGKTTNSFVPFELKRYFGLPTYSDRDSIFAYHFYRLLQRAKNIYLIYNTENDELNGGEKSRFLTQLIYELPKVNPKIKIKELLLNVPISNDGKENKITIKKTDSILEKLNAKAKYGFSPSLLNKYINCSLQFYFHSIAGLKDSEEVEETIGADVLGNVIHKVLELFYTPFIGKKISVADIKEMKKAVEKNTLIAFQEYYKVSDISYGKNLLTIKVANKFITNFLNEEIKTISEGEKNGNGLFINALEKELETTIQIITKTIKIKGKADRIDRLGNITRIVDYKTGKAENKELKFENWEEIISEPELSKSFQLLMYALMYQKMNEQVKENILSGIITFRELSAGLKTVKIKNETLLNTTILNEFEDQLKILLTEIYNPTIEFTQTEEIENCKYCDFKGICNRNN